MIDNNLKELFKIIDLKNKHQLIEQLQLAGYAFAAWKMPEEENYQIIVSLNGASPSHNTISEMDSGYVMNLFSDNHPAQPYYLPADILITSEDIQIDPRVSDTQLDQLTTDLQSSVKRNTETTKELTHMAQNEFEELVQEAIHAIKHGDFEKIVLSRFKEQALPDQFSSWNFFKKLCNTYSKAFCSLTFIPGKGLWLGASPELLIHSSSNLFKTIALAGTKKLTDSQSLSEIAWTQKEIEEQALVSRYIINCFKRIRLRDFHEHGPKTVQAGNLAHLKTEFEVRLNEVSFDGLADQMLELLHPTSAVCGMPMHETKKWIEKKEDYDREFYSGFLGPVNFNEQTNLFVNLRCMKIAKNTIRFYAGAGITEDSIPSKEYEETEMKMNILNQLI